MKNKKCHIVRTVVTTSYRNVETGKLDTFETHMHGHSLSKINGDTPIPSGTIALVLWVETYPLNEIMYCYFPFQ